MLRPRLVYAFARSSFPRQPIAPVNASVILSYIISLRNIPVKISPVPEPSHDEAGSSSDSDSNDELINNNVDSDDDDREPRPTKWKRPSSSDDGPSKKRKHHLQQRSTRKRRAHSKSHRHSPNSHSPLDQGSRATAGSCAGGQLPSPAPSAPGTMDAELAYDCRNLGGSSEDILPALTEVIFRPHSLHCCSFTAVTRDGCEGQGVSFSQLTRLVESIGHAGQIDDFTIKPLQQHLFLLTGFSRHTPSRPSSKGMTASAAAEASPIHRDATRIRSQDGRDINTNARA
jgi:hypothetical protein